MDMLQEWKRQDRG